MFGINAPELLVLAVLAALILGPERLPEYAQQLARLIRELRRMATGAREQLREEMGPEIDDVDWRKLDPRQYDPRRIIKEALIDDSEDSYKPVSRDAPQPAASEPVASKQATTTGSSPTRPSIAGLALVRLEQGEPAPFDVEAT